MKRKQVSDEEELVADKSSETIHDEESEEPPQPKVLIKFSIPDFRNQLRGVNAIKGLRDFANCAEWGTSENDAVLNFLEEGGSVAEITSLLDVTAQQDLATALPVFRSVFLVIAKIQKDAPEYKAMAQSDAETLLATFVPTFQSMLTMKSDKHRKVVLKLLTTLVSLHTGFSRQILNWFTLTPPQLEEFTTPGPVRKAFVTFLMAFFYDDNVNVFRTLLEKKGLLSSILPNLKFDDAEIVVLVLNVMAEKLLKHPKLTKTTKLNVFNTQAIQFLFQLYDWVGPKAAPKAWKRPKKTTADPNVAASVTKALDNLLVVLCTNKKHGVVFHDKAIGVISQCNQLILTALEVLPKPWQKPESSKLVINILKNIPDLIKPCLAKWDSSLEPRESEAWTQAVTFYIQVLYGLQPEIIIPEAMEVLTTSQLQSAIVGILLNPVVLKHVQASADNSNLVSIRCQGLGLLSAIMAVLRRFFAVLANSSSFHNIKKYLIGILSQALPNISTVIELWKSTSEEFSQKNDVIGLYLLELVRLQPSLIEDKQDVCKTLLKSLPKIEAQSNLAANVLQTVCLLDPTFLTPKNKRFRSALELGFSLSSQNDCVAPLGCILYNTKLFEKCGNSQDVFISSWLTVSNDNSSQLARVLIDFLIEESTKNSGLDFVAGLVKKLQDVNGLADDDEKQVFTKFRTHLLFHYCCLPDYDPSSSTYSCELREYLNGVIPKKNKRPLGITKKSFAILNWLLNGDEENVPWDETGNVFSDYNIFLMTLYFTRQWVIKNQFNEQRQSKCTKIMAKLKLQCPRDIPATWVSKPISMEPTPVTLMTKIVETLFTDSPLLNEFHLNDKHAVQIWMKDVTTLFGLKTERGSRWLSKTALVPWKTHLMKELERIASSDEIASSTDILFWLNFLRPTVEELSTLVKNLLSVNTDLDSACPSVLTVWGAVLDLTSVQLLPPPLIQAITQRFCQPNQAFDDVLFKLFSNITLSVAYIPPDFMSTAVGCENVSSKFIEAVTLCAQFLSYKDLGQVIFDNAENINGKMAVATVDILLKKSGFLLKSVADVKDKLEKHVRNTLPVLAERSWPHMKSFIRGERDVLLSERSEVLRLFLSEIAINREGESKISSAFKKKQIPFDALPSLTGVLSMAPTKVISSWLRHLINDPSPDNSWLAHRRAFENLMKVEDLLEEFVALRTSDEWRAFVDGTVSSLSLTSDVSKWAIIRLMTDCTWSEGANNAELADVYNSLSRHSEFMTVLLSTTPVKDEVVGLLLAIVRFSPSVMVISHVQLYLAAYDASLSKCDQTLLQLLKKYEHHLGNFTKFEPLFWGQPAVSHYSVRTGRGLSLWRQVNMKSVLELINMEKIMKTIAKFPINRKLLGESILCEESADLYDPAFMLPLFSNLFSPGAVPYCMSFIHCGGLSFTIAALSSVDTDMRAAAAVVLSRFYSHMQLARFSKQKPIWLHILDCIRFGLNTLSQSPVPSVVTVFWARAILEVSDPFAPLFSMNRLLIAKPSANLRVVPEFFTLFFSIEINYGTQRRWALEVLRDGIRSEEDILFIMKGSIVNTILTFYSASYTSSDLKVIILQILRNILLVGVKTRGLFDDIGLDLWIRSSLQGIKGPLVKPFLQLLEAANKYQTECQLKVPGKITKTKSLSYLDKTSMLFLSNSHRTPVRPR